MKKHRHRWTIQSWGPGETVGLRCNDEKCGAHRERNRTKAEANRFNEDQKKHNVEIKKMHGIGWEFAKKFERPYNQKMKDPWRDCWKYHGYDLMTRIRRWAKKHPKDVICLGCDDDYHASSDIFLILHRVKRRLWGTSVVVVTQCDGIPPKKFFLYPGHAHGLAVALRTLERHSPWDKIDGQDQKRWKRIWR